MIWAFSLTTIDFITNSLFAILNILFRILSFRELSKKLIPRIL